MAGDELRLHAYGSSVDADDHARRARGRSRGLRRRARRSRDGHRAWRKAATASAAPPRQPSPRLARRRGVRHACAVRRGGGGSPRRGRGDAGRRGRGAEGPGARRCGTPGRRAHRGLQHDRDLQRPRRDPVADQPVRHARRGAQDRARHAARGRVHPPPAHPRIRDRGGGLRDRRRCARRGGRPRHRMARRVRGRSHLRGRRGIELPARDRAHEPRDRSVHGSGHLAGDHLGHEPAHRQAQHHPGHPRSAGAEDRAGADAHHGARSRRHRRRRRRGVSRLPRARTRSRSSSGSR